MLQICKEAASPGSMHIATMESEDERWGAVFLLHRAGFAGTHLAVPCSFKGREGAVDMEGEEDKFPDLHSISLQGCWRGLSRHATKEWSSCSSLPTQRECRSRRWAQEVLDVPSWKDLHDTYGAKECKYQRCIPTISCIR